MHGPVILQEVEICHRRSSTKELSSKPDPCIQGANADVARGTERRRQCGYASSDVIPGKGGESRERGAVENGEDLAELEMEVEVERRRMKRDLRVSISIDGLRFLISSHILPFPLGREAASSPFVESEDSVTMGSVVLQSAQSALPKADWRSNHAQHQMSILETARRARRHAAPSPPAETGRYVRREEHQVEISTNGQKCSQSGHPLSYPATVDASRNGDTRTDPIVLDDNDASNVSDSSQGSGSTEVIDWGQYQTLHSASPTSPSRKQARPTSSPDLDRNVELQEGTIAAVGPATNPASFSYSTSSATAGSLYDPVVRDFAIQLRPSVPGTFISSRVVNTPSRPPNDVSIQHDHSQSRPGQPRGAQAIIEGDQSSGSSLLWPKPDTGPPVIDLTIDSEDEDEVGSCSSEDSLISPLEILAQKRHSHTADQRPGKRRCSSRKVGTITVPKTACITTTRGPPPLDADDDQWSAERIICSKVFQKTEWFRVKFTGYSHWHNQWVTEEHASEDLVRGYRATQQMDLIISGNRSRKRRKIAR